MTPAFPARRRAEQFDSLVEAAASGRPVDAAVPAELAELLSVATALREAPVVAPRPEFSASLRERLMAAAPQELTAAREAADRATVSRLTVRQSSQRIRDRRLSAAVGALAVVGASTSMAVASQAALPGDTLYPIKRTIEDVRTGLTVGNDAKGDRLLAQAESRLAEVVELSQRDRTPREADVEKALAAFSEQATHASDLLLSDYQHSGETDSLEDLRVFAAEGITELSRLEAVIPDTARDSLAEAARTLLTIDQAAANACPSCTEGGIIELPSSLVTLVSGVLPGGESSVAAEQATGTKDRAGAGKKQAQLADEAEETGAETGAGTGDETAGPDEQGGPAEQDRTEEQQAEQQKPNTRPGRTEPATPKPTPTNLGEAVGGLVDGVGGVVGGLDDTVGGVLDGVGGVVGGVGGLVGGLLGSPTSNPTP